MAKYLVIVESPAKVKTGLAWRTAQPSMTVIFLLLITAAI